MFSQHNRHKFLKAPQSRIQVEEARRHGAEIDCVVSDLGLQRCQLMCFIDKIGEKFGEVRGDIDTSKYQAWLLKECCKCFGQLRAFVQPDDQCPAASAQLHQGNFPRRYPCLVARRPLEVKPNYDTVISRQLVRGSERASWRGREARKGRRQHTTTTTINTTNTTTTTTTSSARGQRRRRERYSVASEACGRGCGCGRPERHANAITVQNRTLNCKLYLLGLLDFPLSKEPSKIQCEGFVLTSNAFFLSLEIERG